MNLNQFIGGTGKHNKIGCLLNVLSALSECDCCKPQRDHGGVVLANGHHEVTVQTPHRPKKVYLAVGGECRVPVCQGDVDMVGSTLTDTGFVLYADIGSNTAEVSWLVEY